jgi:TolB-like protein/DNA-binding LytR/AlgR family response regulator
MQMQSENKQFDTLKDDSIVVLPFRNMSADKENEYFSDGITEEIINALTKVKGLNVIARTSAFTFKGRDVDVRDVGNQLKVAFVLEGSVRRSGNKVRVAAQLVKASDGFHVFSEVYDRELQDIFEVQDDISNKIVTRFTDQVGITQESKYLVPSTTRDIEAYELYLKGRFNLCKGSLDAVNAAIQYFEAALVKDKKFVLPLTGLAACYIFLGGSGLMTAATAFQKAKELAQKTNLLDENIAETHLALALSSFWHDWDFEQAGESVKRAIRLSPGNASIHGFNAVFLMATGDLEEGLVEAQLATRLDPLSLKEKFQLGELHYRSERFVEAIRLFGEVLSESPFYKEAGIMKAWSHLLIGEYERAIEIFRSIRITADSSITLFGGLAMTYRKMGQLDKVVECMKDFRYAVESGYDHWLSYNYTLLFRALDETDKMFEHLEISLAEKITPLIFLQVDPVWKDFRDDERFSELIDRTFVPEKKDRIVTIQSDTKESFKINLRKLVFIEAQENYSRLVWKEKGEIHEKLLRVTLRHIEDQLDGTPIIRCHRSYMINLQYPFTIHGNSNGYRLKSPYFRESIPISRSLGKQVVARLRDADNY